MMRARQPTPSTLPTIIDVLGALTPLVFAETLALPGPVCVTGRDVLGVSTEADDPLIDAVTEEVSGGCVVVLPSLRTKSNEKGLVVTGWAYRGASHIPEKQVQL